MMITKDIFRLGVTIQTILLVIGLCAGCSRYSAEITGCAMVPRPPVISPDYSGTVIPPNIAPLNFTVREQAVEYRVKISSTFGRPIDVSSSSPGISIPPGPWRKLLSANKGQPLCFRVQGKSADGSWCQFGTITNTIAHETIDSYVVYRLIPPMHHSWHKIEIHQRCLEDFSEKLVVDNRTFTRGCVNCHTFRQNSPESMSFQVRSRWFGLPMILLKDGKIRRVDTRAGQGVYPSAYHSWHPGGNLIAFSRNKPSPFEHTGPDVPDVWDADSDLALYFMDENRVEVPPAISTPDWRETWPSWSEDGKYLYYCRSPQLPADEFDKVRYDLMRISYDRSSNAWGQPERLVSGEQVGLSTAQPRESPDGRWLLFSMFKYGSFPIYQSSSDLYVMDLRTRQYRRLEINSETCDSWHGWSRNSRWIIFASKRGNGLLARIYFSCVDDAGCFHKPVLLPQRDPEFYDSCVLTYNVPELVTGPIAQTAARFGAAITESREAPRAAGTKR